MLSISERGKGKDGNALFVRDLSQGGAEFTPVIATIGDDSFSVVDNVGDKLLIETNHKAPNWRVVLVDPRQPARGELENRAAPSGPSRFRASRTAGGKLFATYLKDVTTRAEVHSLDGQLENEVTLPGIGTAGGFGGQRDDTFVFYVFNSLNVPPTIYRYDIADAARARCSASRRSPATTRRPSRPGRSSTRARTARASRCSSSIARA